MPTTEIKIPTEKWSGQVRQITLGATPAEGGTRAKTVTVGGETQPGHNQDAAASPTNNMAAAYYYSILLMMSVPFTLTGILAYTIFRQSRTEAAGPPDGREQGGGQDAQRERQDDLR